LAIGSSQQSRWVILINLVLDGLATHYMSAIALPQGVFDQLESKRRAFLWYGKSMTTGACCLISWEMVQKSRSKAGLGIKSQSTMNSSLLLIKLLHWLH
jgi:hypothetical protein